MFGVQSPVVVCCPYGGKPEQQQAYHVNIFKNNVPAVNIYSRSSQQYGELFHLDCYLFKILTLCQKIASAIYRSESAVIGET